jgi:hypothetical protein
MSRAHLARSIGSEPEVLAPTQHAVPRMWPELSRPAQQQLAQLMAGLLLRMRQPRASPIRGEVDAD